jgi:glycosyltransferase involved in cell wall biosynthesis
MRIAVCTIRSQFKETFFRALRIAFLIASVFVACQAVVMTCILFLGSREPVAVQRGTRGNSSVMHNQVPGSEWVIDPLPESAFRSSVRRVAVVTDVYLPKMDGVTKLTTYAVQHHMNEGREVLLLVPQLQLYGYSESDFIPRPTKDTPRSRRGKITLVPVPSLPLVQEETRLPIPGLGYSQLVEFKPDLLHMFNPCQMGFTAALYARMHPDIPVIANYQTDVPGLIHSLGFDLFNIPSEMMWKYTRWVHNSAGLNLVATSGKAKTLEARGFTNVAIWDRGINTTRFSPSLRTRAMRQRMLGDLPDDTLVVLYVGRLAPEKTIHLAAGVTKLKGVRLVIVGDGPQRQSLDQLFGGQATFMGMLVGEELAEAYASADIFGFTGTNEVAANVLKEAQASGLPTLAPDSGGIGELIKDGETGFVYQPTVEDFQNKVKWFLDNKDRLKAFSRNARLFAENRSWTVVMEEMERYYEMATDATRQRNLQVLANHWSGHMRATGWAPGFSYWFHTVDHVFFVLSGIVILVFMLLLARQFASMKNGYAKVQVDLVHFGPCRRRANKTNKMMCCLVCSVLLGRLICLLANALVPITNGPFERLTTPKDRHQDLVLSTKTVSRAVPKNSETDVVMCAVKPTCVNRVVVELVILNLNPRRIFILAPASACPTFQTYDQRVTCIPDDEVLPGVSISTISEFLQRVHGRIGSTQFRGRSVPGWYLQQFVKIGVALKVPDLSKHYLIWDSDMLMTKEYKMFTEDGRVRQHSGGFFIRQYASFYRLTGQTVLHSHDWSSFVVHHAVVYKPYMLELIKALSKPNPSATWAGPASGSLVNTTTAGPNAFVWRILENIASSDISIGFSEYTSYASWVLHHHPETVYVEKNKLWSRYPPLRMMPKPWSEDCCPTREQVDETWDTTNLEFMGWELGHLPYCKYNAVQFQAHYP